MRLRYRKEQRFVFKMDEMRFPPQVCIIRVCIIHALKAMCKIELSYMSELLRVVSCSFAEKQAEA